MKTRKLNLHWQSFVLGILLCAVLVVFIGSKVADPQYNGQQQQRVQQRMANMNDLWDKTDALEAKLVALEKHLDRIENALNETYKEVMRSKEISNKILNKK
jgi:septal ring factor EnvC (AmiA/AmiB activator)